MLLVDSYSLLSITLSCNVFLYNSSEDLVFPWSSSFCFMYLLCLFMDSLGNTLLPSDKVHAITADIGIIIKPIPVIDRIIEIDVALKLPIVPTDSKIVFRVL